MDRKNSRDSLNREIISSVCFIHAVLRLGERSRNEMSLVCTMVKFKSQKSFRSSQCLEIEKMKLSCLFKSCSPRKIQKHVLVSLTGGGSWLTTFSSHPENKIFTKFIRTFSYYDHRSTFYVISEQAGDRDGAST